MDKFIGRSTELKKLAQFYQGEGHLAVIYGRRRVGKSALISQSLAEFSGKTVFFTCTQRSEQLNKERLLECIAPQLTVPAQAAADLEHVLEFLFSAAVDETLVLVLDEYPYLREGSPGLDSVLQALLERFAHSRLKLILCGSYIEVMRSLSDGKSPLFGRSSLTIHLPPLDYYDSARFYPALSAADKVRMYSALGGIPYYNAQVDDKLSFEEIICNLIIDRYSNLDGEVAPRLYGELNRLVGANNVLSALSAGRLRFSELQSKATAPNSASLSSVLQQLMELSLVERETPINDQDNRKKSFYFIADNFVRFIYRYIYSRDHERNFMSAQSFYESFVAEDFEHKFVPRAFERLCREYLIRCNLTGNLPRTFTAIGRYWYDLPKEHQNGEFDVVTEDPLGYTFYEAKFTSTPLSAHDIEQEIAQVRHCGLNCYRYGFISRSGFFEVETSPQLLLINLEDLYDPELML
ncbi:MAG: ATP-binding protein [Succinivibrio sp.]|nr:ATP-binding protein [Succinivibrio sp.]